MAPSPRCFDTSCFRQALLALPTARAAKILHLIANSERREKGPATITQDVWVPTLPSNRRQMAQPPRQQNPKSSGFGLFFVELRGLEPLDPLPGTGRAA